MSAEVKFEDNSFQVKKELQNACVSWLHEAGGEIQSQAMRNTRVDSGRTKGSWGYVVNASKGEATIGSVLQNAVWEEFGTGQYALEGNGRKTPWVYKDQKGKWHKTEGKRGTRALFRAFSQLKPKLEESLKKYLRGLK